MLTVRYNDHIVGRLAEAQVAGRSAIFFEYAPQFIQTGIELSPLHLSLGPGVKSREGSTPCSQLPGLFEDSLPDIWGQAIMFDWFLRRGTRRDQVSPLMQLSYIGNRGMGALVYEPEAGPTAEGPLNLSQIYDEALSAETNSTFTDTLADIGASVGGAQAKALIGITESSSSPRFWAGAKPLPEGYEPWLVKFTPRQRNSPGADGRVEYAYSLMVRAAGIEMPPTRLIPTGRHRHFAVKRFDRNHNHRIHHHTLSRLVQIPGGELDYQTFLRITELLSKDHREVLKAYRRAVFNTLARNDDDHGRNHGFLLEQKDWKLGPAYDVTFRRLNERGLGVCGERKNAGPSHLRMLAERSGLETKVATQIVDEVRHALKRWPEFADEAEVPAATRGNIQRSLPS